MSSPRRGSIQKLASTNRVRTGPTRLALEDILATEDLTSQTSVSIVCDFAAVHTGESDAPKTLLHLVSYSQLRIGSGYGNFPLPVASTPARFANLQNAHRSLTCSRPAITCQQLPYKPGPTRKPADPPGRLATTGPEIRALQPVPVGRAGYVLDAYVFPECEAGEAPILSAHMFAALRCCCTG